MLKIDCFATEAFAHTRISVDEGHLSIKSILCVDRWKS